MESHSDNETIKNKILRGKMFGSHSEKESLACHVTLFNTFPPDLTAVHVISKQLHGNHRPWQNLCCNSCCTSWGHGRPLGPDPLQVRDLNKTLWNVRATSDDISPKLDSLMAADSWSEVWTVGSQQHAVAHSYQARPSNAQKAEGVR